MVGPNELVLIDLAFLLERNDYFHDNPKRAGNTLWEIDFFRDIDSLDSGNHRQ
jgi:hypothetical protein